MLGKFTISLKKEIPTVLIHADSHYEFGSEERFNLILSPAFYWCKKERVGVKNLSSAKKIARSVFDANIPEGEYKYLVQKTEKTGEYLFFAYDEDAIVEKLKQAGVPLGRIAGIYFAQNEFAALEAPLRLSDKAALILTEGIVSVIPSLFASGAVAADMRAITLSRHKITIRTYDSLGIKASKAYTLTAASALFALIFFFENSYYADALEEESARQSAMLKAADLPTTSFQLQSIKTGLLKRATETRELNAFIASATAISHENGIPVQSLSVSEKSVTVTYAAANSITLQALFKKSYPQAKMAQNGDAVIVEVAR